MGHVDHVGDVHVGAHGAANDADRGAGGRRQEVAHLPAVEGENPAGRPRPSRRCGPRGAPGARRPGPRPRLGGFRTPSRRVPWGQRPRSWSLRRRTEQDLGEAVAADHVALPVVRDEDRGRDGVEHGGQVGEPPSGQLVRHAGPPRRGAPGHLRLPEEVEQGPAQEHQPHRHEDPLVELHVPEEIEDHGPHHGEERGEEREDPDSLAPVEPQDSTSNPMLAHVELARGAIGAISAPSMGRIFETRKATMFARWNKMAKVFTRISKDIAIAVKAGGPNPKDNPSLRRALQNARGANMPKDKVEAAIKRASGQDQQAYEVVLYEGYGPHGIAVVVETATDNVVRTVANVRVASRTTAATWAPPEAWPSSSSTWEVFRLAPEGIDQDALEMELIDHGLEEMGESVGEKGEKLINNGSSGVLDTADPVMYSPRIWTSIATGKTAEKHGIEFFLIDASQAMTTGKTAGSDLRKCLAVWNILSHAGKTVQVSNWMVSWPAEKVNGTVISDYVEFDHGAYPQDIADSLKKGFFDSTRRASAHDQIYQRFFPWFSGRDSAPELSRGEFVKLNNLTGTMDKDNYTLEESLNLAAKNPADLTMLYLRSVDIASHFYWKYSQLPADDPRLKGLERDIVRFGPVLPEAYRWADEKLGKIMSCMPENTTFIVVSDHGFTTYFNDLRSYNLLSILRDVGCGYFPDGTDLTPVISDTSDPIDPIRKLYVREDKLADYSRVSGKSREQLIEEMRETLLSLKTVSGKTLLFAVAVESIDLGASETTPDLIIRFNTEDLHPEDVLLLKERETSIQTHVKFLEMSGNHDPRAVIIVSGKHAQRQGVIRRARTLDMTPTLLALFDLPVADDMDGDILFSAFKPETWISNPTARIATYEGVIPRVIEEINEPERPDIIQELKAIGYIQ